MNKHGFTLTEVMVAVALMGIVTLIASGLYFQTSQQAVRVETRAAAIDFQQQLSLRLRTLPVPTPP